MIMQHVLKFQPSTFRASTSQRLLFSTKKQLKPKPSADSASWLAKVVGSSSLSGKRASTGEILGLLDMVAARAAHAHSGVPKIATVSIDRLDLSVPVIQGDILHMEASNPV